MENKNENIDFDNLTSEQVGKLFPIQVVPYNPDWEILFEQEKALITEVVGNGLILSLEHFGSTSIKGLASKPTIDIMIEVASLNNEIKQFITQKMETIGYGNMRNAEQENKMTFGKGYGENYGRIQTYHVHIREKGNLPQDEILFRNCLRKNSDFCDKYAELKYALAKKYAFNREQYTQGKTDFITRITKQERLSLTENKI